MAGGLGSGGAAFAFEAALLVAPAALVLAGATDEGVESALSTLTSVDAAGAFALVTVCEGDEDAVEEAPVRKFPFSPVLRVYSPVFRFPEPSEARKSYVTGLTQNGSFWDDKQTSVAMLPKR